VLTSLLLRAGGLVSLSALVEGVWGQDAPASAVGMLILATLTNVFYSLNVSSNWQLIARGVIVVDAVGVDAMDRLSKRG
jgi:ribose/xylose/arabinose/galactoside ABC-type transport system permease subunit